MMKYYIIAMSSFGLVIVVLFLKICIKDYEIRQMKETMKTLIDANNSLHNEIKKMNDLDKIKSENRKETNEKIDSLYSGDPLSNALDILCNDKNRS